MAFMKINTTDYGKFSDITGNPTDSGFCVTATTKDGEVYIHERVDLGEEDARYLSKVVGMSGQITEGRWSYWRTVYGSSAFQQEEAEAAQAAEMIRLGQAHEDDFVGTITGSMI